MSALVTKTAAIKNKTVLLPAGVCWLAVGLLRLSIVQQTSPQPQTQRTKTEKKTIYKTILDPLPQFDYLNSSKVLQITLIEHHRVPSKQRSQQIKTKTCQC